MAPDNVNGDTTLVGIVKGVVIVMVIVNGLATRDVAVAVTIGANGRHDAAADDAVNGRDTIKVGQTQQHR